MANTYKNALVNITGAGAAGSTSLYTVPASATAIVNDVIVANKSSSADNTFNLILSDNSSGTDYYIISGAALPQASNFAPLPGSLVLEESDVLKVNIGTTDSNGVDFVASILEKT
tara:strand:- start:22328 stop:22672 length:345 start_codon:yes stop_codon:yes gene_type:complete